MSITNEAVQTVDLAMLTSFDEAQEVGEPDFVVELIDLYLSEATRFFNAIREALANHDWLTAKRTAHTLRGSSSNLGILQMAVIAGALEQLTADQGASAAELLRDLEDEFMRVEQVLLAERQRRLP